MGGGGGTIWMQMGVCVPIAIFNKSLPSSSKIGCQNKHFLPSGPKFIKFDSFSTVARTDTVGFFSDFFSQFEAFMYVLFLKNTFRFFTLCRRGWILIRGAFRDGILAKNRGTSQKLKPLSKSVYCEKIQSKYTHWGFGIWKKSLKKFNGVRVAAARVLGTRPVFVSRSTWRSNTDHMACCQHLLTTIQT